jgi:hypothetical protein
MSVQMDSFQEAWKNLASSGLDLTQASFEIGWELAHLARLAPPPADGGATTAERMRSAGCSRLSSSGLAVRKIKLTSFPTSQWTWHS